MNIFISDISPKISAINLDDKRVVKMTLESAQMLSTSLYRIHKQHPYKPNHLFHPATIWVSLSRQNFEWLLEHFYWLCTEYTYRYGKIHSCQQYYSMFEQNAKFFPSLGLTPFVDCTTSVDGRYEKQDDIIEKYRRFLIRKWNNDIRTPNWKKREQPKWYKSLESKN
jgi:hypothetical protein